MAAATAGAAAKPYNGKGRLAGRPSNFINNGNDENSIFDIQAQFLVRHYGINAQRAKLIAALFWEARHG